MKCLMNYFLHICDKPTIDIKGVLSEDSNTKAIKDDSGDTHLLVTGEIF